MTQIRFESELPKIRTPNNGQYKFFNPELEKPGLLLPARPGDGAENRRPADVYLASWIHGRPAALDLAVTAPQRQDIVEEAGKKPLASASAYSQTKRTHLDTHNHCRSMGIEFVPLVCESTGAWSAEALSVFSQLARATAAIRGRDPGTILAETLQSLSMIARRCQARAILRRIGQ